MRRRTNVLVVLSLALLLVIAFLIRRDPGQQKPLRHAPRPIAVPEPEPPLPAPVEAKPQPVAAPPMQPLVAQGPPGTVRGGVRIVGEIPLRKRVRMDADPECQHMHAGVVLSDQLVVDANGNVQWAFVYVKSGPIGTPPPAPTTPVLMDQIRCVFTPHMVGVRVGQPLRVTSSDDLLHNVHALPFLNKEFNAGLPVAGMDVVRTFTTQEVSIRIKCDVHPWMSSWIAVVDHPYFSITNEIGSYVIRDLPPGKFMVEVWHEGYHAVSREIELAPGGDVAVDFVLDRKKE